MGDKRDYFRFIPNTRRECDGVVSERTHWRNVVGNGGGVIQRLGRAQGEHSIQIWLAVPFRKSLHLGPKVIRRTGRDIGSYAVLDRYEATARDVSFKEVKIRVGIYARYH